MSKANKLADKLIKRYMRIEVMGIPITFDKITGRIVRH